MHYHMVLSVSYIKNFSLSIYLQYHYSKFQFCLLRSTIIFFIQGYGTQIGWRPGHKLCFLKISAQSTQWLLIYGSLKLTCWCRLLCTAWPVRTLDLCAYASSQESFSWVNETCRTHWLFQNVLCTLRNLFQLV